jgi:predicted dehydrogenase
MENTHLEVKYSLLKFSGFLEIEGENIIEFDSDDMDQKYRDAIGYGDTPSILLQNYGYETLLFLDSLVKGESHPWTAKLEDSLRAHEIVEACYRSSSEHRGIEI